MLMRMPSPVTHGHWNMLGELKGEVNGQPATVIYNECSVCEAIVISVFVAFRPIYKYCPYCGVKTDEMDYEVSE